MRKGKSKKQQKDKEVSGAFSKKNNFMHPMLLSINKLINNSNDTSSDATRY